MTTQPIFVTGVPRSGTSFVAGTVAKKAWGGWLVSPTPANPKGFFENENLRDRVNKNILRYWGACHMGVKELPVNRKDYPCIQERVLDEIKRQGYEGGLWYFKDPKLTLTSPVWHAAFPEASWVIVRRKTEDIVASCLRTPFMRKHSTDPAYWQTFAQQYIERLDQLKEQASCIEVWPFENKGWDALDEMVMHKKLLTT